MGKVTKHRLNKIFTILIPFSLAVIGRVVICQDCFFKSSLYIGHINKTIDNVTCDSWNSHLSHSDPLALNLPDASLSDAFNYCRDPDEKGHPWCYVDRDPHHKTWEFCDVPFCRECYFANRSHDYNGYVTTSMNGKCLAWTGTSFPDSSFPDGSVAKAKNYCRDPDNRGYPHCPTSHGLLPCLIPKCNDSLCADDPSTLCESLKFVICGVKDMALKLCPKTCGMCGFRLMSPVHTKPPVYNATYDACEDNPMAKCDMLKQFICGTAQAARLCPKTCNLCSGTTHSTARSTKTSIITSTSEIVQMYLIDPPIDFNEVYCHDGSELGCILAGADKAGFCNNPTIKNHLCPKFCGTCVPGPTLAPGISTTYGTATTTGISANPSRRDCFFRSTVYLGHISITIDNITCDRWDAHLVPNDPLVSMLPDQRLEDAVNYCRDPDGKGHPWCYVKGNPVKTWEFCDVPYCQECYYANQSHMYNGYVSSTNSGACVNWTGFPDNSFIDGNRAKAKNYCRDPDHTGYPYCLTSSGFTQCTIPQCKGMCQDDPNTRCEDLKMILCQSEHFAKLLCPKSCNMCGFGLLEPVHIHPPVTKDCADDPMARCDQLKELICLDHAKATQYCPRMCNLCGTKSTISVTSMTSATRRISTPPPTTTQDICVDKVNFSCNNPEVAALICIDVPIATNFCRKTCNLCGTAVVKIDTGQCGDPTKESMCQQLHDENCICYDQILASVLCPRYCAGRCGPVDRNVTCPGPSANMIVGRR